MDMETFLPSDKSYMAVRTRLQRLVEREICQHFAHFADNFSDCVVVRNQAEKVPW
jgi:hypothetical protein